MREISEMSPSQIASRIGGRGKKKFKFDTFSDVTDQLGRGQVYPFAGRLISEEEIDRRLG